MLIRFLILSFLLSSALEAKEIIVEIGGIVKLLNKSTSCERSAWGNSDENACRCCITKHHEQNPSKMQASFAYCESKTYCNASAVKNIAKELKLTVSLRDPADPEAFVKFVSDAANLIRTVTLNENELKKPDTPAGELNENTAIYFLQVAAQKGIVTGEYADQLKQGAECLTAKKRNGGAQTLQLFSIALKPNCGGEKTIYILKEMKKPVEEVMNLAKIANNKDLKKYLPQNKPEGIVIALAQQNIEYTFAGRSHFMSLLPTAAGKSMNDYLESYLKAKTNENEGWPKKEEVEKASCGAGHETATFHKDNMEPQDAIFGRTYVHSDLHLDNFFVEVQPDGKIIVTLIDDETMAASIDNKQSIGQDLIRVIAHATSRFLGKSALYQKFDSSEYNEIFLKPFLTCYAKAYPKEKLVQVKRELKKILTEPGTFRLLLNQKVLYNPFAWSSIQSDVNAIIDDVKID